MQIFSIRAGGENRNGMLENLSDRKGGEPGTNKYRSLLLFYAFLYFLARRIRGRGEPQQQYNEKDTFLK